ncbi:MAG: aryl-alcohol dehydrogenase-like predicted oxidoreductase [Candidatus Latescibacterota bacterium]|jgi:aryl-alcohol dehydrogenase-like predicted oxidoreductase
METNALGTSKKIVSRLGFGGAPAGLTDYVSEYTPNDVEARDEVIRAIDRAVELGITYFDTAPGYGAGASERIFGEALAGREGLFVATKVSPNNFATMRQALEESLERLKRSSVDLLQLHGTSFSGEQVAAILKSGGVADQLSELKNEGLIGSVGFTSEDNNAAVYALIESGRFDVMQICYNFIYQHPYEPSRPFGSILEANKLGMGVVTMRAPTSGIVQRWIQQVNPKNTFNYTPALIQFPLANPLVNVALVGMRTVAEVEENVVLANDLEGRVPLDWLHERYVNRGEK